MKVVKSLFILIAMRRHDILYSDWGRRYSLDLYIALNLLFVYYAQSARYFHTIDYHCFNYCQYIFVSLILIALLFYENILTTKFFQIVVELCDMQWSPQTLT